MVATPFLSVLEFDHFDKHVLWCSNGGLADDPRLGEVDYRYFDRIIHLFENLALNFILL